MVKILVIDDDVAIRSLLHELLELSGFEVISGSDGEGGLELAKSQRPDLIICDVMMPGLNGNDVLTQLRQNSTTAGIPFIFLSGMVEMMQRQGSGLRADAYLCKPLRSNELFGAIAAQLMKRSERQPSYSQAENWPA